MRYSIGWFILPALLLASCGGIRGTRPDDMSEREHVAKASLENQKAARLRSIASTETEVRAAPVESPDHGWVRDSYDPAGRVEEARRRETAAAQHLAAASALRTFEDVTCAGIAAPIRSRCPLLEPVTGFEEITGGVLLSLPAGRDPAEVLAHFKCHQAFARARGYEGMESCPLYIRGVLAVLEGGKLSLLAEDAETYRELVRRMKQHTSNQTMKKGAP